MMCSSRGLLRPVLSEVGTVANDAQRFAFRGRHAERKVSPKTLTLLARSAQALPVCLSAERKLRRVVNDQNRLVFVRPLPRLLKVRLDEMLWSHPRIVDEPVKTLERSFIVERRREALVRRCGDPCDDVLKSRFQSRIRQLVRVKFRRNLRAVEFRHGRAHNHNCAK